MAAEEKVGLSVLYESQDCYQTLLELFSQLFLCAIFILRIYCLTGFFHSYVCKDLGHCS